MEVKILCTCGSRYKFDVDPTQAVQVNCPVCGADGTEAANQVIAQQSAAEPAAVPTFAPSVPPSFQTQSTAKPAPVQRRASGPSLVRGSVAAIVAAVIGMSLWAGLIIVTNLEIGWAAWAVGALVGFVAHTAAGGGSQQLGATAAVAAFAAIVGGQFLATRHAANQFLEPLIDSAYSAHIAYAKEAVNAQDDDQIRKLLARPVKDGDAQSPAVEPATITDEQITLFKQNLPRFKRAASGQLSRSEFQRDTHIGLDSGLILKNSFSAFTLLWIFLGVGSAFRLGRG